MFIQTLIIALLLLREFFFYFKTVCNQPLFLKVPTCAKLEIFIQRSLFNLVLVIFFLIQCFHLSIYFRYLKIVKLLIGFVVLFLVNETRGNQRFFQCDRDAYKEHRKTKSDLEPANDVTLSMGNEHLENHAGPDTAVNYHFSKDLNSVFGFSIKWFSTS